jgi:hypothetical protein
MPRRVTFALWLGALGWTATVWTQGGSPRLAAESSERERPDAAKEVGAAACAACHAEKHAAWTEGRHSRMIQPASAEAVLGDFTRTRLTLHAKSYRLREEGGAFFITESSLTGAPVEHRVEYTLGSRRIQHYLTTIDRGRIIVLPPTWDVERSEWFDNVDIIRPDEEHKNPVQQWNKDCVGCHVSQQDNQYLPATRTYATTWVDFGTSCERCHGPGSTHVQVAGAPDSAVRGAGVQRTGIVRPTRLDANRGSMVCAQCHSLRDRVAPGFRAGEDYYDYFVPKLEYTPRKEQDPVYWADGRPRRFSNDAIGLWQSRCFLKGGATCTTCHDAHLPNVDRHSELAPANNRLCTTCHQAIGANLAAHTRHAESGAGSSCIECHMPRVVLSIKAKIRDHTMSVPAPENTVAFGIPNACTGCHTKEAPEWAVETLARWWPNGRRTRVIERARTFTGARRASPESLEGLLAMARDTEQGPLTQANALGYLRGYADERARTALVEALRSEAPILRMVAASSLRGPSAQDALVSALADPSRSVRLSALVSLVNGGVRPAAPADRARFFGVSLEFAEQARLYQDDEVTQSDLGLVHLLNGDLERASEALSISRALNPAQTRPIFLLGLVRLGQQRPAEAKDLFERVPLSDPLHAAAERQLKALRTPPPK